MKTISRRFPLARHNSFTLVELLVVIGIIAILASVALYAGMAALRAAQRAKAFNLASGIQSACLNYYSEYSVYPVPYGTTTDYLLTDATGSATGWGILTYVLCGNVNPSTGLSTAPSSQTITNARGIPFLSLKSSDVDTKNAPLNPISYTTANPYFNIAMDSDYDGILGVGSSAVTTMPKFGAGASSTGGGSTTAGVAVWANCNTTSPGTNTTFYVHTY